MRRQRKVSISAMILVTSLMRMRVCSQTCFNCSHTDNRLGYEMSAAYRVCAAMRIIQLIEVRSAEIRESAV
jgi:hypothetical protein